MRCSLIPSVRAHGASAEVWPCDHPHRKRSWEMSQRFLLRTEIRQKVLKIQPGAPFHHHHAVLQAARSVSVWNQQAGPDPERPARLTQVESERSHSALHLVSGCEISEPTHTQCGSADTSHFCTFTSPVKARSVCREKQTRVIVYEYLTESELQFECEILKIIFNLWRNKFHIQQVFNSFWLISIWKRSISVASHQTS